MTVRAVDADVRAIRPSTAITDYTPFITGANLIVDKVSSSCGSDLSDNELKQVEIYLAAHFANLSDPLLKSEKFEGASKTFERGTSGTGILSSQYGETANMLSGGCLISLDKKKTTVNFF